MKQCKDCGEEKPVDQFYRHSAMSDGYLNSCKECRKAYERNKRKADPEAARSKDNQRYARDPQRIKTKNKRWQERNKDKVAAIKRQYYKENWEAIRQYGSEWYYRNREEVIDRVATYNQTPVGKKVKSKSDRNYRHRYPDKAQAHSAVSGAIRNGHLQREPCEICGAEAEAHHEDYSNPLDVRWLCFKHHREEHGQVVSVA